MSRFTGLSPVLTFLMFSVGLWQKAYYWHQEHGLHADHSLEGKSTELLVRYMVQERDFEEEAARGAVSIYPARVLAKLHRGETEWDAHRGAASCTIGGGVGGEKQAVSAVSDCFVVPSQGNKRLTHVSPGICRTFSHRKPPQHIRHL